MPAKLLRVCEDFVQDDSFNVKVSHNPAIDLSTAVFELVLKKDEKSETPAMSVTYDIAATIIADAPDTTVADNAVLGVAYIPVTREDTSAVPPGSYIASLKRTIGSDTKTIIRTGKTEYINEEPVPVVPVTCYQTLKEKV